VTERLPEEEVRYAVLQEQVVQREVREREALPDREAGLRLRNRVRDHLPEGGLRQGQGQEPILHQAEAVHHPPVQGRVSQGDQREAQRGDRAQIYSSLIHPMQVTEYRISITLHQNL